MVGDGWLRVGGERKRAMQRRQHEEEKGKRVRKYEESLRKEKLPKRMQGRVGMWGSWSRVRCIPQPSAVCSSIRTQIAHPIVQVRVIKLVSGFCSEAVVRVCFSSLCVNVRLENRWGYYDMVAD